MDRPYKIRVETDFDDKGVKAAAEGFTKASAAATKFYQDLEPQSIAELELLRGAEKTLQNRLFLQRAIGGELKKEEEIGAKLESIQAALATAGAKRLAAEQAAGQAALAGLKPVEEQGAKSLGSIRQLHAVLNMLPADLGPLAMLAMDAFQPWVLAVGGLIAAHELLKKRLEEVEATRKRQMQTAIEDAQRWERANRDAAQAELDRSNAEVIRLQHLHDNWDLVSEAEKRALGVEKEHLANTEVVLDAERRRTEEMMKRARASDEAVQDEMRAFERLKQSMEDDEKRNEIATQRRAIGQDQAESQRLGGSIKGLEAAVSENDRGLTAASTTRDIAKNALDEANKALVDKGTESKLGLDAAERDWVYKIAKTGISYDVFVNKYVSFWGHPPIQQSVDYFLEVAAAEQSFSVAKDDFERADAKVRDRERQGRALEANLSADRQRQAGLDEKVRTGTNAANQAEADLNSRVGARNTAHAIDDQATALARRNAAQDRAAAGDPDAALEYAAATSFGGNFSRLFQGVTGQPFRGGNQLEMVINQAFKQHNDNLIQQLGDLIRGALENGLNHSQDQINRLKHDLDVITARGANNRAY